MSPSARNPQTAAQGRNARTPGPWLLGEYESSIGYDGTTGGVRAGPAVLDGYEYGQKRFTKIEPAQLEAMLADARLIAAAPELLAALATLLEVWPNTDKKPGWSARWIAAQEAGHAAIAKAEGR